MFRQLPSRNLIQTRTGKGSYILMSLGIVSRGGDKVVKIACFIGKEVGIEGIRGKKERVLRRVEKVIFYNNKIQPSYYLRLIRLDVTIV